MVLPVALVLPLPPAFLLIPALAGIIWCFWLMKKAGKLSKNALLGIPPGIDWRAILLRIIGFMLISSLLVWYFLPEKLFYVVRQNPIMWLAISVFYSLVSVYPQELIYRHFFYWRYSHLLSPGYFLVLNAVLFSLAHTLFMNNLVFALTLAGGFLFARTYQKTHSIMVTSIEHAIYGLWLYTVGLGEMLAFPGPWRSLRCDKYQRNQQKEERWLLFYGIKTNRFWFSLASRWGTCPVIRTGVHL